MPPPAQRDEEKITVIEVVRGHPILWKRDDPKFKDVQKKSIVWQKVAKELEWVNDKDCPDGQRAGKEWQKIREAYKRAKERAPSGSGEDSAVRYVYAAEMCFVDPYLEDRPQVQPRVKPEKKVELVELNETTDSASQDDDEFSVGTSQSKDRKPKWLLETPSSSKKAKIDPSIVDLELLQALKSESGRIVQPEDDAAGLFGKSVAIFLREIPDRNHFPAQMEIMQIMHKVKNGEDVVLDRNEGMMCFPLTAPPGGETTTFENNDTETTASDSALTPIKPPRKICRRPVRMATVDARERVQAIVVREIEPILDDLDAADLVIDEVFDELDED